LPPVEDVEWGPFRAHCLELIDALDKAKAPLPPATVRSLRPLLVAKPRDAQAASAAVQKLLDAHCLVGVHINPQSRVKAARGGAPAALVRDRPALVLVRVHNEGGVTSPLAVDGPQLLPPGKKGPGRWLEASVVPSPPLAVRLSGRRLEYRLLRLRPRQAGKREATLRFDVGQGTQDLGFRAEVPILFTVRAR
jgi:hypothetical protein